MSSPPPCSDPRLAVIAYEPRTVFVLENRLDDLLDPVLSSRRTATRLAETIVPLPRDRQDFVLHWVAVIARTNPEMAYQFAAAAPQALATLDFSVAEAWIIQAMGTYDRHGLYRSSQLFKNAAEFATLARGSTSAVTFEEVAEVLQLFICGLSGRRLRLDTAPYGYTDTETIFLPPRMALLPTRAENFLIYKVMATLLWAQVHNGTFSIDLGAVCASYADPKRALDALNTLEIIRLEACIERTLPGLAREIRKLRGGKKQPVPRSSLLTTPGASVTDSVELLAEVYAGMAPEHYSYTPTLQPEQAAAVRNARLAKEKAEFQWALRDMLAQKDNAGAAQTRPAERFAIRAFAKIAAKEGMNCELLLDGEPVAPSENIAQLMHSIFHDLGEIPDDYLVAAGDGADRKSTDGKHDPANVWNGVYHEEGAFFYNEWDHKRRHYRKNWCVLRELDVHPGSAGFIDTTLGKYAPQVTQLKRTFELLRGADRLLKKQPDGDDIDLDAVIAAYADMKSGMELSDRLLTKHHKSERDLAVMFMVDMSGSTKGWINDVARLPLKVADIYRRLTT